MCSNGSAENENDDAKVLLGHKMDQNIFIHPSHPSPHPPLPSLTAILVYKK